MNSYKNILEKIIEWINDGAFLPCKIICGRLPDEKGITATAEKGVVLSRYIDGGAYVRLPLVFRTKSLDGEEALEAACKIGQFVEKHEVFPEGISSCYISSLPEMWDNEGKGFVYSIGINVEFYSE